MVFPSREPFAPCPCSSLGSLWSCVFLVLPPLEASLCQLTKKTLFLLSLATARQVGELHVVSRSVSFSGADIHLFYLPEFWAKTESEATCLPHSFAVGSFNDFIGDLEEELLLCPARAFWIYLQRTERLVPRPRTLFVSQSSSRPLSKNAISFFLREVISQAYSSESLPGPSTGPRAHSIRGCCYVCLLLRNYSIRSILESSCWKSASVVMFFYLSDVHFSFDGGFGLGSFCCCF